MNPTFKIESSSTSGEKKKLLFLLTLDAVSFIILEGESNCIALHSYHLPADTGFDAAAAKLKEIISSQDILKTDFENVLVIYGYPTAMIVPQQFDTTNNKKEMLELVFGDQSEAWIKTDTAKSCTTIYSVPKQTGSIIEYLFASRDTRHLYTLLPALEDLPGNDLYCIFCNNSFIVMLLKAGKLQVIQTYQYRSPEDVAYYLLHLCESFEVNVNDVTVHLNGMIGENSNLYNEISKYFLNIQFEALPTGITYPEAITEYPSHYFSHFFAASQCV